MGRAISNNACGYEIIEGRLYYSRTRNMLDSERKN
jgi:hypothetical protein